MYKCNGYVYVKVSNHPFATQDGYILRSHIVMEKIIGRYLKPEEVIHHINEIKDDDRPQNLELFTIKSGHTKFHISLNKKRGIRFKRTKEFCEKMSYLKKEYFKTHKPWIMGKKHTLKTLKKMQKTIFKKGHPKPKNAYKFLKGNQINKGRIPWNKGLKFSHN